MFRTNMLVREALGFFRRVSQHALAFIAQRQVDRGRNLLANRGVSLDLFADGFDVRGRAQKPVGESLVFAQQTKQQVFGLNVRRPKLASFVSRKENYAASFLRVAFEHFALS